MTICIRIPVQSNYLYIFKMTITIQNERLKLKSILYFIYSVQFYNMFLTAFKMGYLFASHKPLASSKDRSIKAIPPKLFCFTYVAFCLAVSGSSKLIQIPFTSSLGKRKA